MASNIIGIGARGRWQIVVEEIAVNWGSNSSVVRVRGILYNDGTSLAYNNNNVTLAVSGTNVWNHAAPVRVSAGGSQTIIDVQFTVGHDANGDAYVSYAVGIGATGTSTFGNGGNVSTGMWLTHIQQTTVPPAPTTPTISLLTQTTLRVQFNSRGDGGKPMIGWELHWSTSPSGSQYSIVSSGTSDFSGLIPYTTYYFWARGRNANGLGPFSAAGSARTLAGGYVKVGGVWKPAVPYVKVGGVWKYAQPYAKVGGAWRRADQ